MNHLTEMGIRNPICSLIRTKAGISLYRVESKGKRFVLKVFDKQKDTREILNYQILSSLHIPTLPLIGCTKNAILLPDVDVSTQYRLGRESDLSDLSVARAVAKWYKELHSKGSAYLSAKERFLYDESDVITAANMELIAERTGTKSNDLWKTIADNYDLIRKRIDALPRTLTYNDFYWTNLIVSKDQKSAFMFDYNLLGKGTAYGDIRNVTSSLFPQAAVAFLEEYGAADMKEEKKADAFVAPLVNLFFACEREDFPNWAEESLKELKDGSILRNLVKWLELSV